MYKKTLPTSRREGLREYMSIHGCYSREENLRIYDNWFAHAPRYMFRAVDRKYAISNKLLCDIGCAYGMNLPHCVEGSYGLDRDEDKVKFATCNGLPVYQRDVVNDDLSDLPKVDVIWCSEVLEHLDSPHIALRKMNLMLNPNGLLFLHVPTYPLIPSLRYLPFVGRYVRSYDVDDHIYAFTRETLKFLCDRAGFRTIELSPFYPQWLGALNHIPLLNRLLSKCVYVGRKISGWKYLDNASRKVSTTRNGFKFKR